MYSRVKLHYLFSDLYKDLHVHKLSNHTFYNGRDSKSNESMYVKPVKQRQ